MSKVTVENHFYCNTVSPKTLASGGNGVLCQSQSNYKDLLKSF